MTEHVTSDAGYGSDQRAKEGEDPPDAFGFPTLPRFPAISLDACSPGTRSTLNSTPPSFRMSVFRSGV